MPVTTSDKLLVILSGVRVNDRFFPAQKTYCYDRIEYVSSLETLTNCYRIIASIAISKPTLVISGASFNNIFYPLPFQDATWMAIHGYNVIENHGESGIPLFLYSPPTFTIQYSVDLLQSVLNDLIGIPNVFTVVDSGAFLTIESVCLCDVFDPEKAQLIKYNFEGQPGFGAEFRFEDCSKTIMNCCKQTGNFYVVICDEMEYWIHEDEVAPVMLPNKEVPFREAFNTTRRMDQTNDYDKVNGKRRMKPKECDIFANANLQGKDV